MGENFFIYMSDILDIRKCSKLFIYVIELKGRFGH